MGKCKAGFQKKEFCRRGRTELAEDSRQYLEVWNCLYKLGLKVVRTETVNFIDGSGFILVSFHTESSS